MCTYRIREHAFAHVCICIHIHVHAFACTCTAHCNQSDRKMWRSRSIKNNLMGFRIQGSCWYTEHMKDRKSRKSLSVRSSLTHSVLVVFTVFCLYSVCWYLESKKWQKIEEKSLELKERSGEAVQLINIANEFYTRRSQVDEYQSTA